MLQASVKPLVLVLVLRLLLLLLLLMLWWLSEAIKSADGAGCVPVVSVQIVDVVVTVSTKPGAGPACSVSAQTCCIAKAVPWQRWVHP